MFRSLWHAEVEILPVVCALLLCEIPGIVRQYKKLYYVPIYFSLFPFRELNEDLSIYLGEDWFSGTGRNLSEEQLTSLRKRIMLTSLLSLAIAVVATPAIAGFLSAFFMRPENFTGLCVLFIGYKMVGVVQAAIGFKAHAVANTKTMTWFWLIYLVYFGCFLTVFEATYEWALPFVAKGDWAGLWKALRGILFLKITVLGFIVVLLGAAATNAFTDRELRAQLLKRNEEAS